MSGTQLCLFQKYRGLTNFTRGQVILYPAHLRLLIISWPATISFNCLSSSVPKTGCQAWRPKAYSHMGVYASLKVIWETTVLCWEGWVYWS